MTLPFECNRRKNQQEGHAPMCFSDDPRFPNSLSQFLKLLGLNVYLLNHEYVPSTHRDDDGASQILNC